MGAQSGSTMDEVSFLGKASGATNQLKIASAKTR